MGSALHGLRKMALLPQIVIQLHFCPIRFLPQDKKIKIKISCHFTSIYPNLRHWSPKLANMERHFYCTPYPQRIVSANKAKEFYHDDKQKAEKRFHIN
jgi:hypothetical protein